MIRASAKTIWRVPVYLPYLQPPLTDEAVTSAEKAIGYKLPEEYLALLRAQNGGYIRFSLPENVHNTIAGIGPHFPSLTGFDWSDRQQNAGFPLEGLVPFDGDGHWFLCFDYRGNPATPRVTHADIELDRESPVAETFAEYLAMLRIDPKDQFVLESVADLDSVIARLSSALSVDFGPPDLWAHGYPMYRARVGKGWVWLSPNTVPRGFIRSDDSRYAALKHLTVGVADRYPGLPPQSYLLSATDAVRPRLLKACERTQLIARPLRDYLEV